ncbi:serine/threonine protein kinase, CMGC, dual-specificity [Lecanora helva]
MANSDVLGGRWKSQGKFSGVEASSKAETDLDLNSGSRQSGETHIAQKSQRDFSNDFLPSRPAEPTPFSAVRPDPFPTPATRRRQSSFRDQRALQQPGYLQRSPSKRLASNSLSNPQRASGINVPNFSQGSQLQQTPTDVSSRVNDFPAGSPKKRNIVDSSGSFDFLPSVDFDELHSSIRTGEDDVNSSFNGRKGASQRPEAISVGPSISASRPATSGPLNTTNPSELSSRIALNGSSLRRQNSTTQSKGQTSVGVDNTVPPNGSIGTRARRKTYFPGVDTSVSSNAPTLRAPRQSIGPGILIADAEGTRTHQKPPSAYAGLRDTANVLASLDSPPGSNVSNNHNGFKEGISRHSKTKSLQPPPKKVSVPEQFYTPTGTPEQGIVSPVSTTRSPGRTIGHRTLTPSSSKRLSVMPTSSHATGLGARTISPTDARRMKRMSMMPTQPPLPFTPPITQRDAPCPQEQPMAPSPSLIPRKSVTPSSSRTTPDPNRKSYSSGVSNSSNTSYNSCLASSSTLRTSQNLATSRLPTLKTRSENVSIGDDEVVPPVPAIPKAYESPKGEFEHPPFFSARKSSLGHDTSSLNSTLTSGDIPSPIDSEPPKLNRNPRHRQNSRGDAESATLSKPQAAANSSRRRTLQPLRLPPLNLLPISAPTTSKIAALHGASAADSTNRATITPPPKLGPKVTPTTPMTASKANFSKSYDEDDNVPLPPGIRSSSSHYNMRTDAMSYRAASSSSVAAANFSDPHALTASRAAMSPFVSSSLPKTSGDFGYARLEKSNTFDMGNEGKPAKLMGPRLQRPRKASKDDSSSLETTSPMDASSRSIGSSLRRKLSLTRKRSNSKAQTAIEGDAEASQKPLIHDDMPPPKLPASATWNGPLLPSPSPSQQTTQSRAARVASNSSSGISKDRVRSSTWDTAEKVKREARPAQSVAQVNATRTARAALEGGSNNNALSLKEFLREAKTLELTLDRDDLSAEEEMKRLAAKRKETEVAAKEVDALQRRATAKDRVGPTSALKVAQLNIFERGEIVDYKDIYFCGTKDARKHLADLTTDAANFGYDDDRGDYNIVTGDHLSYRYEIVDILGKGSFGQVVRCIDHKTGVLVAIKIIRNKKRFHHQALIEVNILQKLREWDPENKHSMVTFVQSFYFRGHLCISTELLGMNLYEFIKCHDFRGFSLKLIRRFAKQLLSSLILLKSKRVIHCDLKPENVLLAHPTRSEIKVIDFGSSCHENEKVYTYIQSRFYRSPEVILGMTYGMPIDMWSLGCILAELLTGYPIFPGENEQEQLACIMEVFGPPEKHLIEKSTRKKLFFDSLGKPRITVSTKGKRRRPSSKSLQQALKCEDDAFLDFISRCLRWDPDRRLKPDEALKHEFIAGKTITKNNPRPRTAPSNPGSSPIKRFNSISQTPAASNRPLPEPPATGSKLATGIKARDNAATSIQSPSKSAAPTAGFKRTSTMNNMQPPSGAGSAGVKRTVNGTAIPGSALPRVMSTPKIGTKAEKNVDLAAAAAVASLRLTLGDFAEAEIIR